MTRFAPFLSSVAILTIASPLYAQTKPLPSGQSLLQSAYSAYDKSKTLQLRIVTLTKDSEGKSETTEMTAVVENDSTGKITRGRLTMKQTPPPTAAGTKTTERQLLNVGDESFLILPLEKKYAPKKQESRHLADLFRSILGSLVDEKTTYSVAEAKLNGVPVYQITTSVMNGLRTQITLEKETRLFRRILMLFRKTEVIGDIKIESQQRNAPIPEEMFAKPGADYTLDPAIAKDAPGGAPTP